MLLVPPRHLSALVFLLVAILAFIVPDFSLHVVDLSCSYLVVEADLREQYYATLSPRVQEAIQAQSNAPLSEPLPSLKRGGPVQPQVYVCQGGHAAPRHYREMEREMDGKSEGKSDGKGDGGGKGKGL